MFVQDLIKSFSTEDLTREYLLTYPAGLKNIPDYISVGQAKEHDKRMIMHMIENLKRMPIVFKPEQMMFFAYRTIEDGMDSTDYDCVAIRDAKKEGADAVRYSVMATPWPEVMAMRISPDRFTQRPLNLLALAVWLLHEITWYGFTEEEQQKGIDKLNSEADEAESGNEKDYTSFDDWQKEEKNDPDYQKYKPLSLDATEKSLLEQDIKLSNQFSDYSISKVLAEGCRKLGV